MVQSLQCSYSRFLSPFLNSHRSTLQFQLIIPAEDRRRLMSTRKSPDKLNGPLDCDTYSSGKGCSSECEGRHLDLVELLRFKEGSAFHYPKKPSLVITASPDMGRTASTWAYNAVRLLYRQAGEACDSYWIRSLSKAKLEQRLQTGAHVVVKTHEQGMSSDEFGKLAPMFTNVVVSVRKGFPSDPMWMKAATFTAPFEQVVVDEEKQGKPGALTVLRRLAQHIGIIGLSDSDFKAVDCALMTLPMPRGGSDPVSKLWYFHSRRGGRAMPEAPSAKGKKENKSE
eukprot:gb/GEZN01009234.1/.p1 GENE.gb/GEZN01009234.1/~~gb/GEZN01009234.1/.p1  ORF type:complete len:283 (-),score=26.99 gb/GEZN01009234.1/:416-1264(-)